MKRSPATRLRFSHSTHRFATATGHPAGFCSSSGASSPSGASYYGMRAILLLYLTTQLACRRRTPGPATRLQVRVLLVATSRRLPGRPVLRQVLDDRRVLSPLCFGQVLIGFGTEDTIFLALALLAMGSGVIKPNISALMGMTYDQQRPGNEQLGPTPSCGSISRSTSARRSPGGRAVGPQPLRLQVAFLIPAAFDGVGTVHLRRSARGSTRPR